MGCEQSRSLAVDDDDSPQNNPDWYLGGGGTGARARRKKATTRTLAVENDSYMNPDWYPGGGTGTGTGTGTSTGTRARRKKATTPTRTRRMNDKRVASHDSDCMTCPKNDRDYNYPIAMAISIPTSAGVVVPTTPNTTSLYQEKCRQLEQADHANEMDILLGLA